MLPRTYVASYGVDTNGGQLATPCRSIGAALAQTDPGGEIIVLDSAGYGTVSINKSVAIIAPLGVYAGITVAAGAGIDVTSGVVTLRGLTLRGPAGAVGVHVGNATVYIDRCVISGLVQFGIHADVANGEVYVSDTLIGQCAEGLRFDAKARFSLARVRSEANGNIGLNVLGGARGSARDLACERNGNFGISVQNDDGGTTCYLALDGALITANGAAGISVGIPSAARAGVDVAITRSTIADNGTDGVAISTHDIGSATAAISDTVIDANGLRGVAAMGVGAIAMVCGNRITRNGGMGLSQSGGGIIRTEQDNMVDANNVGGPQTSGALTALTSV